MNSKEPMTFEQWWSINSTPELIGQFEIRRYKGMTKENVLAVWQSCEAEQAKEVEALKHDLYSYMEAANGYANEIMEQSKVIAELQAKIKEIEASLEFYSDPHNWSDD